MRELAKQIITEAAVSAGIPADSVIDKPSKQNILLPLPRIELDYMPEELERNFKRISKWNVVPETQGDPVKYRLIRSRIYKRKLTIAATIRSDTEAMLARLTNDFIVALPAKAKDNDNNLVVVTASKAVRGGFGYKIIEAFVKRSNSIHVVLDGMITKDEMIPLIRDVNIKDNTNYK